MSDYHVHVCPFCGVQAEYDGGYDGYGWVFECEHDSWMPEYGEVQPLKISVTVQGLQDALDAAQGPLEDQRQERAAERAEREKAEEERWASLTPEQKDAELRQRERMTRMLDALVPSTHPLTMLNPAELVGKKPVFVHYHDDLTPENGPESVDSPVNGPEKSAD